MMQRNQKSKEISNSVLLGKRVKVFALLFVSLMYVVGGQASAETTVQFTDNGHLFIKMVYPTDHLYLRGRDDDDTGNIEIQLNKGEYKELFAGVNNVTITAWGTEKNIEVYGITIDGDLTIRTGYEGDRISIDRTSVRSNLKIVTGSGDDYIGISSIFVGERATLLTGAGDDYLPLSHIHFSDVVRLLTGTGEDVVSVRNTEFANHVNIKTGDGVDYLISDSVNTLGNARLFTGAGEDVVILTEGNFDQNLTVYTGADNDVLKMVRNTVSGNVVLGGASGLDDEFRYDGQNEFFKQSEIQGFEIYRPIGIDTGF